MMLGLATGAALDAVFTWARWQRWLHPVAALRARLRERAAPPRPGGTPA